MVLMKRSLVFLFWIMGSLAGEAQPNPGRDIQVFVFSSAQAPLSHATVSLLNADSSLVRTAITDEAGGVVFRDLMAGNYICKVTMINYQVYHTSLIDLNTKSSTSEKVLLKPEAGLLNNVTVSAKKPLVQFLPDKTVINVEAGITNAGTSVLEVLEKSPGVTIDRGGTISLKGRSGVQVMIDGKLTQLSGADLQNLLSGMNASQIETIELMDNPPAKYDAAGNAGLINIRTKKMKQKGFNGSFTIAYGQGRLPKSNNSVQLNFRNGSFNFFFNYGLNASRYLLDLYALRTYYKDDGSVASLLEQPYNTRGEGLTHSMRTGFDYYLNKRTTLGMTFTGLYLTRDNLGNSTASWKTEAGTTDSLIYTSSHNTSRLKQGGINLNARHSFNAKQELSADLDLVGYNILSSQYFENKLGIPGSEPQAAKGEVPSSLRILTAKADYTHHFDGLLWEAGWKSSRVNTDNLAQYYYKDNDWEEDLGKSNHFLYTENIHALYSSIDKKTAKWDIQAGLRYEYTSYDAKQLGNSVAKDSSFNRKYNSLFPTTFVTYKADSLNSFSFRAGRRIDRPGFQKLNPFVSIINKYTFQQGNPYFLPQYTWNFELSHLYKDILTTGISYSLIKDYFSQIFFADTAAGTIVYTEGNVGRMRNYGLSLSVQISPASWWSLTGQVNLNHKIIEGLENYKASITQMSMNLNNQFRFKKGWAAELSGFYLTKNQNDLQEVLNPTGQMSAGVSKQLFKNKGTARLTFRDIFYTQVMAGWTHFRYTNTIEYFKLMRDTRVVTMSFTYRFGKAMKGPAKRSTGGASDEIERVGTVN